MIDQGIQRISREIERLRLQHARRTLKRKPELKWWLIYGPPRCGTSYMVRVVKACSILYVSDWGLAPILEPIPDWLEYYSSPDFDYIQFDYERFVRSISENILDNAFPGTGAQLDFVYKQATLGPSQYQAFVKMWGPPDSNSQFDPPPGYNRPFARAGSPDPGPLPPDLAIQRERGARVAAIFRIAGPPERAIFCFREPAGYIASAVNKFIHATVDTLQQLYISSTNSYQGIGGDIFEYTPELTTSDYFSFLEPLDFEGKWTRPFRFKGEGDHENTTEEMWEAYHIIKDLAAGRDG